jgi:S-DNA-T family DNA segregation ATPase FtsK/SpoIIIE
VKEGSGAQTQEPGKPVKKEPVTPEELEVAKDVITETQRATTSTIQRRMKLPYERAALIMEALEECGFVGPSKGNEPREILMEPDTPETTPDQDNQPE